MRVIIWGEPEKSAKLYDVVKCVLDDLGLVDFVELTQNTDNAIKNDCNIQESFALVIEEESIHFKDMIFEGIVPEEQELKSMFYSIIGGGSSSGGCAPGGCGSGCSC